MHDLVTNTAGLHAAGWQALFDQVLLLLAGGREVEPFTSRSTTAPTSRL
jgi:hypothetical protein